MSTETKTGTKPFTILSDLKIRVVTDDAIKDLENFKKSFNKSIVQDINITLGQKSLNKLKSDLRDAIAEVAQNTENKPVDVKVKFNKKHADGIVKQLQNAKRQVQSFDEALAISAEKLKAYNDYLRFDVGKGAGKELLNNTLVGKYTKILDIATEKIESLKAASTGLDNHLRNNSAVGNNKTSSFTTKDKKKSKTKESKDILNNLDGTYAGVVEKVYVAYAKLFSSLSDENVSKLLMATDALQKLTNVSIALSLPSSTDLENFATSVSGSDEMFANYASNVGNINKELGQVHTSLVILKNDSQNVVNTIKEIVNQFSKDNELGSTISTLSGFKFPTVSKASSTNLAAYTKEINKLTKTLPKLTGVDLSALPKIGSIVNQTSVEKSINNSEVITQLKEEIAALKAEKEATEAAKKAQEEFNDTKNENASANSKKQKELLDLINNQKQFSGFVQGTSSQLNSLASQIKNVDLIDDSAKGQLEEFENQINNVGAAIQNGLAEKAYNASNSVDTLIKRLDNFLENNNNVNANPELVQRIQTIRDKLVALGGDAEKLKTQITSGELEPAMYSQFYKEITDLKEATASARGEINGLALDARGQGLTGNNFFTTLSKDASKFATWMSAATLVNTASRYVREMYENVRLLDSAMVELKKVTNESDTAYNKFLKDANKSAKQLASTLTDLVNATANFAKMGYNMNDSLNLAEVATLYSNVGDNVTTEDATKNIISTMKAFGIEANNAIDIVDKLNEVDILASHRGDMVAFIL